MAERRMFAKTIVDSDAFLDMPLSTQALYFHLSMRADDDGFVNNPKKIQRMINASEDDLKLLITKRFVLVFDNGVIVIKHWRLHNTLRKDRYKPTIYQEEFKQLRLKEDGGYTERLSSGCQEVAKRLPIENQVVDVEEIEEKPERDYSLDSLASKVCMSKRTFTRHFKQAVGMSVTSFVIAQRLRLACNLLESSNLSIDEIALKCGFKETVQLRRNFYKRFAVSPKLWRKTFKEKS